MILRHLKLSDEEAFFAAVKGFPDEPQFKFIPSFDIVGMTFKNILTKMNEFEQGLNLPQGFVPDSLLFAFIEDGSIVGRSSIRHELNDYLSKYAGHIGYGVLPMHRKKGYASEILKQSLEFCKKELNLSTVLVTCNDNNIGSIKTLKKNGYSDFSLFNDETLKVPKRHYLIQV